MPQPDSWLPLLPLLHAGAAIAWIASILAILAHPQGRVAPRLQDAAAALLAIGICPLLGQGGWWIHMPASKLVPAVAVLGLGLAAFGSGRLPGRLSALVLAAFFGTLGLVSARNGGPLPGFVAAKAVLAGAAFLLLPFQSAVRLRAALVLLLLGLASASGLQQDFPILSDARLSQAHRPAGAARAGFWCAGVMIRLRRALAP